MGSGSVKGDWRMVVGEAGRAEGRIPHVKGRHKQTTAKPTHTRKAASGSWCEGQRGGGSRRSRLELVQGRRGAKTEKGWSVESYGKGRGRARRKRGKGGESREKQAEEGPWATGQLTDAVVIPALQTPSSSEQRSQTGLRLAQGAGLLGQLE